MPRPLRAAALAYAALGLAFWPAPLLGLLHAESSAAVAAVGFFAAGVGAARAFAPRSPAGSRDGAALRPVLAGHLLLLAIPWALLTLTLGWRPNCGYLQGLGLFFLFAPPSVVLGVALAYALTGTRLRWPGLWLVLIGLAVAVGGVAFDLGLHPQFYTYNHVFGGVLGPIYDEELSIRPGLFAFRAVTLLWAGALVLFGRWLRLRGAAGSERRHVVRAGAVVLAVLAGAYAGRAPLGLNTSAAVLERALPGRYDGGSFVLHYDPAALTPADLGWIVDEHRYRYARLRGRLGVGVDGPFHTYLYPDPDARGRLTGSRETGVTPVWLARPQLHLLQDRFTAEHFGHELAHVFSRAFGAPPFRSSPAVGLVEGLAVAVEPADGLPSPAEQVAASLRLEEGLGALSEGPAEAVAATLSPLGFWTGRGAVSYTTSGAFVGWLLDRYGAARLGAVYRTADFEAVYGEEVGALAARWEAELRRMPVGVEAESLAAWRFRQPSLFEKRCPHHVPRAERLTREAAEAEAEGHAGAARRLYAAAHDADTAFAPALAGWAARTLADEARPLEVAARLEGALAASERPEPGLLVALGDAYRLAGRPAADRAYGAATAALPPYAASSVAAVRLRQRLAPEALRALLAAGPPAERAARLEAVIPSGPAAAFFAAALRLDAGEPARALALLERFPPDAPGLDAATGRALAAFRAHAADRARAYGPARGYAAHAAAAFRAAGEESRALQMDDLAAKAAWMRQRAGEDALSR